MKEKALIIVNPNAYNYSDKTKYEIARNLENQLDFEIVCTEHRGHAKEIAEKSEGYDLLVSGGGDGTNFEILNGIRSLNKTLGFLPLGGENNFARTIKIPKYLKEACERLYKGETRLVDVGRFNDTYFMSNAGIGLDGEIIRKLEKVPRSIPPFFRVPRLFRYLYPAISSYKKPEEMVIEFDGRKVEGKNLVAMTLNTPYAGNGMKVAPYAKVDDGILDLLVVGDMSPIEFYTNLPKVYQGNHITHPKIDYKQLKEVYIRTKTPVYAQVDGELFEKPLQEIYISIYPNSLKVRC